MSLRREYFLEQFDSNLRTHVIEFSKRLTDISKRYDVLIFVARKAACLADCLDELELSNFHCVIILKSSHRFPNFLSCQFHRSRNRRAGS